MKKMIVLFVVCGFVFTVQAQQRTWIRINQLGYPPAGVKTAVWCSKDSTTIKTFQLVDAATKKFVFTGSSGKAFGAYGPFKQSYRLNFSRFKKPGRYYLQAGGAKSPEFEIGNDIYKGTADFCLRYMRQQRTGFNPFLKDSCHTHDGYTLYAEKAGIPDSTHIDVVGGWHDATDYLQYVTTSANATYHLLMAYRDFPKIFRDEKQANGLNGKNKIPDVLDEARWGIDWLLKMHPRKDLMFNQIADDRDHAGMRIPKEDSFYGRGFERPVYFVSGEPQQRQKFMNNTTGTSSTAAKFASVFALAETLFETDSLFRRTDKRQGYYDKALDAYEYGNKKKGVTQTASVKSPYIYAEDNWVDDMELAAAAIHQMINSQPNGPDNGFYISEALEYAKQEKITPWLGADTAKHYQWYPFINLGHYELAKQLKAKQRDTIIGYYKEGIDKVWQKAKQNAFYRGVPFIWCSNNLTASFAIQCYWYRQLTNDTSYAGLEQANFDWLFGCNPWGTSMVYGLPAWGDTPVDPHSSLTHIKNYPIDGGLIDGPVYGSIFNNLLGLKLYHPDEYAEFQSDLVVYHDDYGDYSTNEPTMDGTASLIYLLAAKEAEPYKAISQATYQKRLKKNFGNESKRLINISYNRGAVIRGDSTQKTLALVFTGDEFADGGDHVIKNLRQHKVQASFFFTGRFYRNPAFKNIIQQLKKDGHYLGAHSDQHLLYCDWNKRDSLLVTKTEFTADLLRNYEVMKSFGIKKEDAEFFLPPYEWYNDSIAAWTKEFDFTLINYTPGTLSHADYTTPDMKNYKGTAEIYMSIVQREQKFTAGLNGFILLMHIGTDAKRKDKLYYKLSGFINLLKEKGYSFVKINELLN